MKNRMGLVFAMLVIAGSPASLKAARGPADSQLAPQSVSSVKAGETLLTAGQRQAAIDAFEAALAADPRNIRAYLGLARAAEADGLPGKAVRFYREALQIDPNDVTALELQGNALVMRGATARAEANLERLKTVCATPCPSADRLRSSIAKGPPAPVIAAADSKVAGKSAALDAPKP